MEDAQPQDSERAGQPASRQSTWPAAGDSVLYKPGFWLAIAVAAGAAAVFLVATSL